MGSQIQSETSPTTPAVVFSQSDIERFCGHLSELCHTESVRGGWWHDPKDGSALNREKGTLLCLIHSEISEALEGERKDLMDDKLPERKMVEVELADALIRIFDYAGAAGLDIGGAVAEKILFNRSRSDHKAENRQLAGGKAF